MLVHTFTENRTWDARVLVACGLSVDHTWLLCELNIPSQVKVASSVKKTVSEKRLSLERISKYQLDKANREPKSSFKYIENFLTHHE